MPWYMSPNTTCKVLNRIANRYPAHDSQNLIHILDYVTQLLWSKQERYYEKQGCSQQ
jgi:hypothetical protein